MAGMKVLLTLAFTGSIGMTFVIIAGALHPSWWPLAVVIFYVLAPLPTLIANRHQEQYSITSSQSHLYLSIFITMGIVVSSFALPIVLSRTAEPALIAADSCYLTIIGNIVIYLTILGFFVSLYQDDARYGHW